MSKFKEYISKTKEYGVSEKIEYPVVKISGLPSVKVEELLLFETGERAYVSTIDKSSVTAILLSEKPVKVGVKVARTEQSLSFPVGDELLGKGVDPLGELIFEDKSYKKPKEQRYIDSKPKTIETRSKINKQLTTGLTLLDVLIPLGKGQRELVLGDRRTGKTSALIPVIKSQSSEGSIVIYTAIGKRSVEIKRIKNQLDKMNKMKNTIILATKSSAPISLIDLTPYCAMTLAEYFNEKGKDVLVIFDDLTTHAAMYREMALMQKKFPGRESYPGDVFYKHARLLERAGNFKVGKNTNAITCLSVAETVDSDLSAYIISNLIGITDGHILFDKSLFNKGLKPPVDVFLSVTRVGKQTQTPLLRDLNRVLTRFLSEYNNAKDVSHFGAEISSESQTLLDSGNKIYNFISYDKKTVLPLQVEVSYLLMFIYGYLRNYKIKDTSKFKSLIGEYIKKNERAKNLINKIFESKSIKEAEQILKNKNQILLEPCNSLKMLQKK